MSIYGIAGFVDGFTGGVDTAHKWKDRKRDQKRQDRADAMEDEVHQRRIKIWDQQISAADRAAADEAALREAYSGSVDAANAAAAGAGTPDGPVPAPVNAPGKTSGLPPPMGILPLGLPEMPGDRQPNVPPTMPSPAELRERAAAGGAAPGVVNAAPVGGAYDRSGPVAAPGAVAAPQVGASSSAAAPGAAVAPPGPPPGPRMAPQPSAAISDELYMNGPVGARYMQTPEEAAMKAGQPAPGRPPGEARELEIMRLQGIASAEGSTVSPEMRKAAYDRLMEIAPESVGPGTPAIEMAPMPPVKPVSGAPDPMDRLSDTWQKATAPRGLNPGRGEAPGPVTGKAPASAPEPVKELADTAATAMAATTTPAMEAASAAASRGLPETKTGKPTEKDRDKYAGDFMDHYREVGAPMVVEALLKQGQVEKAMAFQEFMDRGETKAGMENWAKAAFAATVGDMDTFATEIMEAYDRLDYFPDGTTIVREESGFTRDKAGNITGAKLTFRDAKTGNTFDQVFTDPNDLVKMGITLLAPEEAFEYYYEEQVRAAEASRGIAKEQKEEDKALQKRVDEVAKLIFENSKGLDGVPTLTYSQAQEQARAELTGGGAAAEPPVARRP